jgi:ribonuclease III
VYSVFIFGLLTSFLQVTCAEALKTFIERAGLADIESSELLQQALRHPSSHSTTGDRKFEDNGRLEVLGDRVLQHVVCRTLLQRNPDTPHYKLQADESAYVNNATLAQVAEELGMNQVVVTARGEAVEERGKAKVLASALEATIGALFKERGVEAAAEFVQEHILSRSRTAVRSTLKRTPVQGLTHKLRESNLPYPKFLLQDGKEPELTHNTTFIVDALCHNTVIGTGSGTSKRKATSDAASDALANGRWKALRGSPTATRRAYEVGAKGI